jgi:hypothetical protein
MPSPPVVPDLYDLLSLAPLASAGDEVARARLQATIDAALDYQDIRRSNSENAASETKKLRTQERYLSLAREVDRRIFQRDISGGHRTNKQILMEEANKRGIESDSGAYEALKQGRKLLNDSKSGRRRKTD